MSNSTRFQSSFAANWRLGVIALIFCFIFVRLGFWQLVRAEEKKQWLTSQRQLMHQAPMLFSGEGALPIQYQPVRIQGRFIRVLLLLDNQIHQHQFGYDVLTPFLLKSGEIVMVNRGWVPGDVNRDIQPDVTIPDGPLNLEGTAYFPSENRWLVAPVFDKKSSKLVVIERFDARVLSHFLHKSVYPFIIRLSPSADHGYVRDWPVVSMPPERHVAYAVQWFIFAFLAVALFVGLNLKKKK